MWLWSDNPQFNSPFFECLFSLLCILSKYSIFLELTHKNCYGVCESQVHLLGELYPIDEILVTLGSTVFWDGPDKMKDSSKVTIEAARLDLCNSSRPENVSLKFNSRVVQNSHIKLVWYDSIFCCQPNYSCDENLVSYQWQGIYQISQGSHNCTESAETLKSIDVME